MPTVPHIRRATLSALAALAGAVLWCRESPGAADVPVPISLQVELLGRMVAYDRNFPTRASGRARVLILTKGGHFESELAAEHIREALARLDRFGGLPHERTVEQFKNGDALTAACKAQSIDVVYLTPGLEPELSQIVAALSGLDLLSVSAVPAHVPGRVVLGFDLQSGKPKMLVHLLQARLQNVAFRSDVLKLTRVYQ